MKQTFSQFLASRLNFQERLAILLAFIGMIAMVGITFTVKPEFGALMTAVFIAVMVWLYFQIRKLWGKSQS